MQNRNIQLVIFTASLVVYNILFWKEKFGINLPLFSILMGAMAFRLYPENIRTPKVLITAAGTLLAGIFVVINNSAVSKFAHISSFFILLGFLQESQLKTVYYALLQSLSGLLKAPVTLIRDISSAAQKNSKTAKALRIFTLAFLPLVIFFVFYFIYTTANPQFEKLTLKLTTAIADFINKIFEHISIEWIVFSAFGMVIIISILYKNFSKRFSTNEASESDNLSRIKQGLKKNNSNTLRDTPTTLGLKNEMRSGIILLAMVNLMLLVVNIIDIKWMWFGFEVPQDFNLKQFVHEGTYLLILSILLSMGILLYLFRKNQNFFPLNKTLKLLAYAWIAQNVILTLSVFLRNYHYISYHGLAYRRIGVIVFLLLTLSGLITVFIKINRVKTVYFLLKNNTWTAYSLMIVICLFNWNQLIANYNLNHWNWDDVDIDFYLDLSDRELPLLYANFPKIQKQMEAHKLNKVRWVEHLDYTSFGNTLDQRRENYLAEQDSLGWQSWNYADATTYKTLQEIKQPIGYLQK
jgi:hypothetical protein